MTKKEPGGMPEMAQQYEATTLSPDNFEEFKEQLIDLMVDCFPQYDMSREFANSIISKQFLGDQSVVALLTEKSNRALIGFSKAHIYSGHPDLANIEFTGISSGKRGNKLIGPLIEKLEEELRKRNVQFVRRQSRIKDGYADAVERHYGDRIIEKRDSENQNEKDPKRFFKIRL
jgi:hypothetical protein